jgi:UDP-N-acetylglucosamine 1-carboxyvinyltransferase
MDKTIAFSINGGNKLSGKISVQGAKNEALQVICATLLTVEKVTIENIPEILDVLKLIELLETIGVEVQKISKGKYSFIAKI